MKAHTLSADLLPRRRVITLAWLTVALAYTPAVWLVSTAQGRPETLPAAFGAMILFFLPWGLLTPRLLRASARMPLGTGQTVRALAWLGLLGAFLIPAITGVGLLLEWAAGEIMGTGIPLSLGRLTSGVAITSFFSVPIYAAVIGVGQTLLWVERTRERERLLARARLDTLRAQINPHFLFNALGAVGELAYRDADAAQTAIARLADVLRSTLATDAAETTLGEEIAVAKDHVELHRLLLAGPLNFRVTVSPLAWRAQIPVLILQPLIENAVVHALSLLTAGAWLSISANVASDRLSIEVTNAISDVVVPSRGLGSGLPNIRERLAGIYGTAAALTTRREPDRFVAIIGLPLVVEKSAA